MPDPATTPHLGRLHILTHDEVQSIFSLPQFTAAERGLYFSLTPAELEALAPARSFASKLNFILQLGYFKARQLFFNFAWQAVAADVEFIRYQYFPHEKKQLRELPQVVKNTVFRHRRIIAALGNYQFCGRSQRAMLTQAAKNSARISGQPIYIFRELFAFLQTHRIILPGYSFLQDLIAQALRSESARLRTLLQNQLTADHTEQLENLLSVAAGFYELTHLKHEPRDFSRTEIKRETARGLQIKELYHLAQVVLPSLGISNQSIAYYASLVMYYRVDKLKRFATGTTSLYLLCFIHQRYQRVHDNLINCLLYRVRLYSDQAKEFATRKLSSLQLTTHQQIGKAADVLRLLTDEQFSPETPFGLVQQQAFAILGRDEINQIAAHIAQASPLDESQFRWEYLDKIAAQFKLHLRAILLRVDFTPVSEPSELAQAIHFLRQAFTCAQPLTSIHPKKFPLGFLAEKTLRYLYQTDPKSNHKQLHANRYEFLVYQAVAHALQSGDLHCRASQTFRSFEEDLIDDKTWQHKEVLLEQSNLSVLAQPIELHLQELESQLEGLLTHVNRRISDRENKSFHRPEKSARWTLKYPTQPETPADAVFAALPQTDLYQVLHFVQQQTDFIGAFSHVRGRYVKQQADQVVLAACLMAWGTNTGLGKMGKISDFKAAVLQTASDNFIRPETLHQANARIINDIAKFDFLQQYNLAETVHSSSDGQKFETRFQTINARSSPKYLGLKKGIVAYTLVANHIPVNARIIGANEHESHFVFDLLFNNTTNIQPTIHSTDTHGSNQVNFALLHLFGYQFAPRFKDIYDTVTNSLYGFKHPSHYADYPLKPMRKINQKLIIQEWENITRIVLSLAQKATTQHVITSKLSSYQRTNKTKQALWEYDNIIRSLYLLAYIDSPPLRQNVHQALNRGENYHQLKRAVAFANFGKRRFHSEYEQNIWNECSRLLTNCILYYNLTILSELHKEKALKQRLAEVEMIKQISPTAWQHINFMGRYDFKQSVAEIKIADLIKGVSLLPFSHPEIPY